MQDIAIFTDNLSFIENDDFSGDAVLIKQHQGKIYAFIYNSRYDHFCNRVAPETYRSRICEQILVRYRLTPEQLRLTDIHFSEQGPVYTPYEIEKTEKGIHLTSLDEHPELGLEKLDQLHEEAELELLTA